MTRLGIVVEGRTEESFINEVLSPYLIDRGVLPMPIPIGARTRRGEGGDVHVDILARDLCNALDAHGAATSLVDLYGFRGREGWTAPELENAIFQKVTEVRAGKPIVRPYVQVHEFECLLFSEPEAFRVISRKGAKINFQGLRRICEKFETPEDINDRPNYTPSARLQAEVRGYRKIVDGIAVIREIGIERIARKCPRFREWLIWMEGLGKF